MSITWGRDSLLFWVHCRPETVRLVKHWDYSTWHARLSSLRETCSLVGGGSTNHTATMPPTSQSQMKLLHSNHPLTNFQKTFEGCYSAITTCVFKKKKKKCACVWWGGGYFMHFHAIYLKMQLCLTLVQLALTCSCNCAFLIEGLLPNIHTNTGGALPSLQRALQWLAFISHLTLTLNQVYSLKT